MVAKPCENLVDIESPHVQTLGTSCKGGVYLFVNESLKSCMLIKDQALVADRVVFPLLQLSPLSLDCITKHNTPGDKDASMLSTLDLTV